MTAWLVVTCCISNASLSSLCEAAGVNAPASRRVVGNGVWHAIGYFWR